MGKICSILLALALVLSFTVVPAPVSADEWPELTVNITAPLNGADIVGGTEFTVTANVTNNGTHIANDVWATIVISGNATLEANEVATKFVDNPLNCGVNWTIEVSWTLVCIGGGTVNITVNPSGTDPGTGNHIGVKGSGFIYSDTVSVIQEQVLDVAIFSPDGFSFNVTQGFEIKANVKNISSLNATEVKLTIDIDRYAKLETGQDATLNLGSLASNDTSWNYTWHLECTGDGFSMITVRPSGKVEIDGEEEDIPDDACIPATVIVSQGDFDPWSIDLVEGWNLISLPLIPLDPDIEVVLAGIMDDVTSVWYWDAATGPPWKSFAPDAPYNLHSMEDGKAYWINMEAARTLNIAGTVMPEGGGIPHDYDVVVGWNMVGFKSTADNVTVEVYLAGTEYIKIYGFEDGAWFTIPGTAYNTTYMVPGLGYWVAFIEPGTIYP